MAFGRAGMNSGSAPRGAAADPFSQPDAITPAAVSGTDCGVDEPRPAASLTNVRIVRKYAAAEPVIGAGPQDLLAYWDLCRKGRPMPLPIDLDESRMTYHWPGSVLFAVDGAESRLTVAKVFRPHDAFEANGRGNAAPWSSLVMPWLLPLVESVAKRGLKIDETAELGLDPLIERYRCIALPLGERRTVEAVLCHVWSGDQARGPDGD